MDTPKDNVRRLFGDELEEAIETHMVSDQLSKRYADEKYIFICLEDNGAVRYHIGKELKISELAYLQKVLEVYCNDVLLDGLQ